MNPSETTRTLSKDTPSTQQIQPATPVLQQVRVPTRHLKDLLALAFLEGARIYILKPAPGSS